MHDPYAMADVTAILWLTVLAAGVFTTIRRVKKSGRKPSKYEIRIMVAFGLSSIAMPILARMVNDRHLVQFLSILLMQVVALPIVYQQWKEHQAWIAAEIAAGRTPKEARVYNDWARPDPE